jgi:flagellar protein FlaJ
MNPYRFVNIIIPKAYRKWVETHLIYANIDISPERFLGICLFYGLSIAISTGVILFLFKLQLLYILLASVIAFVSFQVVIDSLLVYIADRRAKFAEEMLPDALRLMAINVKSGITPEKALLLSARPEFGLLEQEIRNAAKKTVAGTPIEEALDGISKRIDSKIIDRTFKLIIEGIKKGGELGGLLEQTSEDIRNTKILEKEVAAQVTIYAIFIFFAAALAAPVLYAVSTYLVETMSRVSSIIGMSEIPSYGGLVTLKVSTSKISQQFLITYSLLALCITSFFGGMLIGLIQSGTEKAGVKYIPILLTLDVVLFFLIRNTLVKVLGII